MTADEPTEVDPREAHRAFQIGTLRHLLEAASMRNWEVRSGSSWEVTSPGYGQRADVVATFPYKGDERAVSDARLVAAMRNALPDLIEELDRLRALVGGRSAAPTRDEVREKLLAACDVWIPTSGNAWSGALSVPKAIDVMLDLLSRSAAEPPEDPLRADIEAFIRSVEIDLPTLPYEVQTWLEEELEPLRRAVRVAAEPNDKATDDA